MKRLSILIILLLVSVGIGFAQEVETNTIDTENTIIPQEEIQQQDIADEPPPVQEEESPEETEEEEANNDDDEEEGVTTVEENMQQGELMPMEAARPLTDADQVERARKLFEEVDSPSASSPLQHHQRKR